MYLFARENTMINQPLRLPMRHLVSLSKCQAAQGMIVIQTCDDAKQRQNLEEELGLSRQEPK